MIDREPRTRSRPATLAAWCPTCRTTQACAPPPGAATGDGYRCNVCGDPASNPVLRLARRAHDPAGPTV